MITFPLLVVLSFYRLCAFESVSKNGVIDEECAVANDET